MLCCCYLGCGGTITEGSGTFTTPNYPESYPSSAECIWTLRGSGGSRAQVVVTTSLEGDNDDDGFCANDTDTLQVLDMSNGGALLRSFCGATEQTSQAISASWLQLNFTSNAATSGRGISVRYFFGS